MPNMPVKMNLLICLLFTAAIFDGTDGLDADDYALLGYSAYYRPFDSPGICLPDTGKSREGSGFTLEQCAAKCTESSSCIAFDFLEEGGWCLTSPHCDSQGYDGVWVAYKKHECGVLGQIRSAEYSRCVPCGGWGDECCLRDNGMGLGPDKPCGGDYLCNADNRCGWGQFICGEWQTETSSCWGDGPLEKLSDDEDLELCKQKCLEKEETGCCGVWVTNKYSTSGCYFKQGGIPAKDMEGNGQTIYCSTACEKRMMLCDEDCEEDTWKFFATPDRQHGDRCTSETNIFHIHRVRNICESTRCWACDEVANASPDLCSWTNDGVVDGTLEECQASCRNNLSHCFGIQWTSGNCDFITDANCDVRGLFESGSGQWLIQSRSCFYHGTSSSENDRVETKTTLGKCSDSDTCIASQPSWGASYTCANSVQYCEGSWAPDMLKCCPLACQAAGHDISAASCIAVDEFIYIGGGN